MYSGFISISISIISAGPALFLTASFSFSGPIATAGIATAATTTAAGVGSVQAIASAVGSRLAARLRPARAPQPKQPARELAAATHTKRKGVAAAPPLCGGDVRDGAGDGAAADGRSPETSSVTAAPPLGAVVGAPLGGVVGSGVGGALGALGAGVGAGVGRSLGAGVGENVLTETDSTDADDIDRDRRGGESTSEADPSRRAPSSVADSTIAAVRLPSTMEELSTSVTYCRGAQNRARASRRA